MSAYVPRNDVVPPYKAVSADVVASAQKLRASADVTFDAIRADLKKNKAALPDGWIHQALVDADIPVMVER